MPTIKKSERVMSLYEAILELENVEDCMRFFEDLCSSAELSALEQRYAVAELLAKGAVYQEIEAKANASTATISRVKRVLYGGSGGLNKYINRLQEKKQNP